MRTATAPGPVCTFDASAGFADSVLSSQRALSAKFSYTRDPDERKRVYCVSLVFCTSS